MASSGKSREISNVASAFRVIWDARFDRCRQQWRLALRAVPWRRLDADRPAAAAGPVNSTQSLKLPQNPQVFGNAMPSVARPPRSSTATSSRRPTSTSASRLLAIANGGQIPADEVDAAAPAGAAQPDRRDAADPGGQGRQDRRQAVRHRPDRRSGSRRTSRRRRQQLAAFLEANGSNIKSLRRQIEGEIAWQRLQRDKIESHASATTR